MVVAEPMNGDRFPVVGRRGDAGAVQGLQAFGVADRNVEPAGDVPRHVAAAEGDRVDMDEPAAGEHADRGRAAAEIDDRGAKLRLVVDERREARGVWRRHHRLDPQMAALDHQHQVAGGRRIAGGEVKIDAEFVADHAFRIAHVPGRVEPEGGRKRVQDRPPGLGVHRGGGLENVVDVVLGDGLAAQLRRPRRGGARRGGRRTC